MLKFYDDDIAKKNASTILQTIDVDNSNAIDFYEFRMCCVSIDPVKLMSKLNDIKGKIETNQNGA